MKAWFNEKKINLEDLTINQLQRAVDYGDGFFETIHCNHGKPVLLKFHLERLKNGLSVLFGEEPQLDEEATFQMIQDLWKENNQSDYSIVKIRTWRSSATGYSPEKNQFQILITMTNSGPFQFNSLERFGIIGSVRNSKTQFSSYKTLSALNYVMAGTEKNQNNWEEGIILDQFGLYSEGVSSNLFILNDGMWLTPDLSTGCVGGIMRRFILENLHSQNQKVQVSDLSPSNEDLNQLPWFTINSLTMNYFVPADIQVSPEMEKMQSFVKKLVD